MMIFEQFYLFYVHADRAVRDGEWVRAFAQAKPKIMTFQ